MKLFRAYNPQVRVGNWNEDICLEEDLLNGKQHSTTRIKDSNFEFQTFGEES